MTLIIVQVRHVETAMAALAAAVDEKKAHLPLTFLVEHNEPKSFTYKGRQINAGCSASQNLYHYGRYTLPSENPLSLFGLMAGAWPWPKPLEGLRIPVGQLDVAIMKDLGIPTR